MNRFEFKVEHCGSAQLATKDAKDKIVITARAIDQCVGMVENAR